MKKLFTIYGLILLSFLTFPCFADSTCPKDLEALPILSKGRVKPLKVHAKNVIKFISGKTNNNGQTALETYCHLSLMPYSIDDSNTDTIQIKVDHIKTKEFLGLSKDDHFISPQIALQKLQDMKQYLSVLENRNDDSAFINDLKATISRISIYDNIASGQNWQIPIILKHSQDNPHTMANTNTNGESEVRWISIQELTTIFKDKIQAPEQIVTAARLAGLKYNQTISDDHLLELKYDNLHIFQWAMLFVFAALLLVVLIKKPTHPVIWLSILLVLAVEITGITFRIMISGRAPVTNMYETVMWVGLGGLFFSFILSLIRKEKLFVMIGLCLNLACLFMMTFANNMLDSNIQPLVPVLRDNFWLSTHVTMITISYAAFALSWLIANYYMIKVSLFGVNNDENKRLNMLCYDCLKIGVVLLAGGIILGGVWADYSWGRFWGWDPKETWALIALLTYIAILHGRYAGWISPKKFLPSVGMAYLTIIMAWFGVNYILATGLHSYGFSNGGAIFIGSITFLQFVIFGLYLVKKQKKENISRSLH